MDIGLLVMAVGALIFIPAALARSMQFSLVRTVHHRTGLFHSSDSIESIHHHLGSA
jgi:hypothetical protein